MVQSQSSTQKSKKSLKEILSGLHKMATRDNLSGVVSEPPVVYAGNEMEAISDYYIPVIAAKGVDIEAAELIASYLKLSQKQIAGLLHMSDRSYRNHLKNNQPFKGMEAEMLITLLNLLQEGIETFGEADRFGTWLHMELEALNFQKPFDFLNTISGTRYILELLKTIQAGAFA